MHMGTRTSYLPSRDWLVTGFIAITLIGGAWLWPGQPSAPVESQPQLLARTRKLVAQKISSLEAYNQKIPQPVQLQEFFYWAGERRVDLEDTRVREREISGVIASLYTVPRRAVKEPPAGSPGVGCIESLWLEGREVLDACNAWRREAEAPILWEVEEVGAPILSPPP